MEVFKLGDKIKIPSKKVTGEIVFIGETQFSDGIWFGIVLDKPVGKHNGTINGVKYFKCQRNCGIFIKENYLEKERIVNCKDEHRSLIKKRNRCPNNTNTIPKVKTEMNLSESETICNRERKQHPQNENCKIICGDSIIKVGENNADLTTMRESGDNNDTSGMKAISLLKKHPNHLKACSEQRSLSYLNENKYKDKSSTSKCTTQKKLISSVLSEVDINNTPNYDDSSTSKRVIYPNYLKSSSKFKRQHFCAMKVNGINKINETINDDETGNNPEKSVKIQTSCVENEPDNPVLEITRDPNEQKFFLNSKEKGEKEIRLDTKTSPENNNDLSKTKPLLKNRNKKILKGKHIQDICDKMMELEVLKQENKDLMNKLCSTEAILQDTLTKYNEAQNEIKHLKYDNECQRKQIKFQKNHLKLLKINQTKKFMKSYYKRKLNQKKLSESIINEYNFNDMKYSDDKFDLENLQPQISRHRVRELKARNNAMVQGLIEIRDFLKTQYQSQPVRLEFSNSDSYTGFSHSRSKKSNSVHFIDSIAIQKRKTSATEETKGQLNDYLEILQDMTQFNKIIKEKGRGSKDCEEVKLVRKSSSDTNLHLKQYGSGTFIYNASESIQNISFEPKFNINVEDCIDSSNDKMDSKAFQNFSILKENYIQAPKDQNLAKGVFKPVKYSHSRKSENL